MTKAVSTYHQRVAEEKRAVIVQAATDLFLELGYDRTSLARIATQSGVSRATLFKQFPTKAALFEAIVGEAWSTDHDDEAPPPGDLAAGLTTIGRRYADLLLRPQMVDLFRIVIAELPRFPDLADAQFTRGKLPYFESVRRYLVTEKHSGGLDLDDPDLAATQFLGMISNYVFWPALLVSGWTVSAERVGQVVDEAVATMVARYVERSRR
ncbi:TetR/AcrR family transcriptional regulator [Williamsia deligens]|uniref:TetR/AcrR family transcriptional regulator n=1 Tax=Williamsia deligens TaxID=321325 RepID=A0ABW3G5Z7_9NOCA|nr:TetR/AcrR family transcriptional regulator [Williamsia deligens]MCP2193431.1 transcriptional regulator, TetR family [Williamsia deligens]